MWRRSERDSAMASPNRGPPPRDILLSDNNAYSAANPRMQRAARDSFTSSFSSFNPNPGSRNGILLTQLLSEECQARRFNPQFIMTETVDGLFTCDVKLFQAIVKGDRLYHSEFDAKCAVANKALGVIRSWPPASDYHPPDYRPRREENWLDRAHRALTHGQVNTEQNMAMTGDRAFRPAHRNRNRDRDIDRVAEQAHLIDHVRNTMPESSLMFLEGLVAGARAAQLFATTRRHRSRSAPDMSLCPPPTNHRERSRASRFPPENYREDPLPSHRSSANYHERSHPRRPSADYSERSPSPRHDRPSPTRSHTSRTGGHREMSERPRMLRYTDSYRPVDSYVPDYARGQQDNEWPHDRYHW